MSIQELIDSFKGRVDQISEEWENIMKFPVFSEGDMIARLEDKLDIVQQQNYSIIIDLDNIKRELHLDKNEENIIFCNKNGLEVNETTNMVSSSGNHLESSPMSPSSAVTVSQYLQISEDDAEKILSTFPPTEDMSLNEEYNQKEVDDIEEQIYNLASEPTFEQSFLQERTHSECNIKPEKCGAVEVKRFDLNMIEAPKSINQLYDDFDKNLKYQIKDFENQFGKGQLSKLNKIRTYQRRRALISEIEKFSKLFSLDIRRAIDIFESYRTVRGKTVPYLYNNLAAVVLEIRNEYESTYYGGIY
ncbi:hypothetical protein C6P45_003783 [Maudiozyma exigua]|uniref:Transcription activator GCR1-like domain-containing protein n=1 Tax=Maudiozyma exigua TaxID=34358 RepID=A0A9P6WBD4_MAUEX|nr:hypothetical protein C6P45_003783 [Kazachstania exigua]